VTWAGVMIQMAFVCEVPHSFPATGGRG